MVAVLRFGLLLVLAVLSGFGVGQNQPVVRLDLQNTENWSVALAQFPKLTSSQQITVLEGLKSFVEKGQKGHLPDGEHHNFLPQLATQRRLLALPEIDSFKSNGYMQQAKALGELAANAFDYALMRSSLQVRAIALEMAEELMPQFYEPLIIGGHCGTGYDYLIGNFRGRFSESLRSFGAKNLGWVEKADPREKIEDAKQLLRAYFKLPSARLAIVKGLESDDEDTIDKALIRVMQWPDPEFIPYLQKLVIVEDSRVRPFWYLTEAVLAYREGASAVIEPVLGKIKVRSYLMSELANYSCRESWTFVLRLTKSAEPWQKELGVSFVKAMAQGYWMPVMKPKTQVPRDAMSIANQIVFTSLSDPEGRVRAAAVRAHDWSGQTDRLVKFANDASAYVRENVAFYISDLPNGIREELIWKLAGDPSIAVQRSVGSEVDDQNDLGLEAKAKKAITSASPRERSASAVVLPALGFESDVLPLLKDRDAHVRASALMSLQRSALVGTDLLLGLCADIDRVVVGLAVNALLIRIDDYKEELAMLNRILSVASSQHTPLIQRHIERVKRAIEDDENN